MTRERREEVLLIAVVVSLAIHIGLMLLVRSEVMTRSGSGIVKPPRREPMRIVNRVQRPDPAKIAEILDLKAVKDAPPVVESGVAPRSAELVPNTAASERKLEAPAARIEELARPPEVAAAKFEIRPVGLDEKPQVVPMTKIETPSMKSTPVAAPEFTVSMPTVAKTVAVPAAPKVAAPPVAAPRLDVGQKIAPTAFTPAAIVYEKVDEKVVAEEKEAVRSLMNTDKSADLQKFVNVTMTAAESGGWRYFKVMMVPRASLPIVPKDVVLVIDGSGSIGKDRLSGCRRVAQKIMRSCMNSGDRFNLVVFRNAFSYAFKSWQECTAESFAAGDRWLNRQTAHGRTDVFSTISSVLTLPRDPKRPLIALVVTDGDANMGVSDTAEILSKFTALNDGLISVYMYGVKGSANRELIDVLTRGNRGESFIYDGWLKWKAGSFIEGLGERFRDPVLSDLKLVFAAGTKAEAYPRRLKNLYRGETLKVMGRVPAGTREVAFSVKGLNGADLYEGFFKLALETVGAGQGVKSAWEAERQIDLKLR